MRAFVGVLLAAAALGGALALHNEVRNTAPCPYNRSACTQLRDLHKIAATETPGWVDPVAIAIALAGGGCGLLLLVQGRKRL